MSAQSAAPGLAPGTAASTSQGDDATLARDPRALNARSAPRAPTFRRWLREQRDRPDPVGDLAEDFIADKQARGIRTPAQLRQHMRRWGACLEARQALCEAVREFRRETAACQPRATAAPARGAA